MAAASSAVASPERVAASAGAPSLAASSGRQETQYSTGAQGSRSKPASSASRAHATSGSKRGWSPRRSTITGSTARVTSSRIAGTERKFSTSTRFSPPAARTRSHRSS